MTNFTGILTIHLHLAGCQSLKDKRSVVKSLIAKLRNKYNASIAEVGYMDKWQDSEIAIVVVSNSSSKTNEILQNILNWISNNWHSGYIVDDKIEIIY